jgi:type I site-specific restriction-modification system R (restriction) subunit
MSVIRLCAFMSLLSSLLFAAEAVAQARVFCCEDAKGRKVCADYMPPECARRAYEERNSQGELIKKYAAPLTPEQQARRDAELAGQEEARRKALEEKRQAQALLANYASEKEIDAARDRALGPVEQSLKKVQAKLDAANKTKQRLDRQRQSYKNKPLPDDLRAQIRDNDSELQAQRGAVDTYTQEMDKIRARFADEKQRYLAATGKAPTAEAATSATSATPATPATPPAGK